MYIYIPTLSRPKLQRTLKSIPKELIKKTRLVISENEFDIYAKEHGEKILLPTKAKGIAAVRQWVLENSLSKYSFFLDDDMDFSMRKGKKLVRCEEKDFKDMYDLLLSWLKEGILHVGVSQRAGNNHVEEDYVEVTRMNNAYCYDVKKYRNTGVRFDRLRVMEDFDVTLSLLELGFKNRVTFKYCWGQTKSGMEGGCSTYRTAQVQDEAAKALAKLHPGLVKITIKSSKEAWEGIGTERTDVIISWKKAYERKMLGGKSIGDFLK